MTYEAVLKDNKKYILVTGGQISKEQDALDLISACWEHDSMLLLLPFESLSDDFLDLSTKVAGLFLQKLTNYNVRTAAVIDPARLTKRFQEFSYESAKGSSFRIFNSNEEAADWLVL